MAWGGGSRRRCRYAFAAAERESELRFLRLASSDWPALSVKANSTDRFGRTRLRAGNVTPSFEEGSEYYVARVDLLYRLQACHLVQPAQAPNVPRMMIQK